MWPDINVDVRRWARYCTQCQKAKVHRHTSTALSPFRTPDAHFDCIVDLVGPLPTLKGYTYIHTCMDRYTWWPEATPLSSITAETVAHVFSHAWISRFRVPSTVIRDHGHHFESKLWQNLMVLLGSRRACTTAYHPQSNGIVGFIDS